MVRALSLPPTILTGSNPGVNAIYGLSLLLVLSLAPRSFSNSNSIWNTWTHSKKFSRTPRCFVGKQITKNDGIISRHPALNNFISIKYKLQ